MDLAAPIHSRVVLGSLTTLSAFLLIALGPSLAARSAGPTLSAPGPDSAVSKEEARAAYAKPPLALVPNKGQLDARVRYSAQAGGASFYFTQKEAVFSFAKGKEIGAVLRLSFLGANPAPRIEGRQLGPGRINYLLGNDPAKWQTNLPTYGEVVYRELWPGIDMVFRGGAGTLKYEFRVQPGARVRDIRLSYRGARGLSLSRSGNLVIRTLLGALIDARPVSYQRVKGKRSPVASSYVLRGRNAYGFALGRAYEPTRPLVIDPGLVYSTFIGNYDGEDIVVDSAGNAYLTGIAAGVFPTTPGAFDETQNGNNDAFVTKLNSSGSALVYSTFLGGTDDDRGFGVDIDSAGNVYATGSTRSADFPTTPGAYDTTHNTDVDVYVTKLKTRLGPRSSTPRSSAEPPRVAIVGLRSTSMRARTRTSRALQRVSSTRRRPEPTTRPSTASTMPSSRS